MVSHPCLSVRLIVLAIGSSFSCSVVGVDALLADVLRGGDAHVPAPGQLLKGPLLLRRAGQAAQGGLRVLRAVAVGMRERTHAVINWAEERLLASVQSLVGLQLARLGEAAGAPRIVASIWLLTFNL